MAQITLDEAKELLNICDRYEMSQVDKTTIYWCWNDIQVASVEIPDLTNPNRSKMKPKLDIYQLRDAPRTTLLVIATFQDEDIQALLKCGDLKRRTTPFNQSFRK